MVDRVTVYAGIKGFLTFFPGMQGILSRLKVKSQHSGQNAEFCFELWNRSMSLIASNNIPIRYDTFAELGAGGSLGIAFCAILSGFNKCLLLDKDSEYDHSENKKILEKIISLFLNEKYQNKISSKKKTSLPEYHDSKSNLNNELIRARAHKLRQELDKGIVNNYFQFYYDWEQLDSLKIDFLFSRAVMEHVSNPNEIYHSLYNILSTNSYMLHDIELHSHGLTKEIDGHYKINENLWRLIHGKRAYFLNRYKSNDHTKAILDVGFRIITSDINYIEEESDKYKEYGMYILAQKI